MSRKLVELNQKFYASLADPFAVSRFNPQKGFFEMLSHLPERCETVLDVGCGNGRFGHFLQDRHPLSSYVGVDFTVELLTKGENLVRNATFYQRDMSQPDCLAGLGQFDLVICLAAMHHIPGREARVQLLRQMGERLVENGRIMTSTWQFMDSERQRRKVRDWSEIGLSAAALDPTDYLLTWQKDGFGLRYVAMIDEAETAVLAELAGLNIAGQFRNDGREGNLSLYTIFEAS
ncbi:MAG: class I SAM-dependent methyltransferase [Chloroflexota bacterium]